ncbi:hypothetical protein [Oceaniglobus indicus]|uniref:hypothetical protein n=1 Tax=Oceaniglobus indicus TaxID=2047749 RepID=UPI001F4F093E|nr:hypothetical protein [Oceaniglobus indicus]
MTGRLIATLMILTIAVGCGRVADSRLNPLNWFGSSRPVAVTPVTASETGDPRPLVDQVIALRIDRNAGGAIIRATGLPAQQGYWDGELIALNDGEPVNGVIEYRFHIKPPLTPTRVSTQQSREVIVGQYLTRQELDNVREIRVSGARNARAVSR